MANSLTEVLKEFIQFQMEHPDDSADNQVLRDDSAADNQVLRDDSDNDDGSFASLFAEFQKATYQPDLTLNEVGG